MSTERMKSLSYQLESVAGFIDTRLEEIANELRAKEDAMANAEQQLQASEVEQTRLRDQLMQALEANDRLRAALAEIQRHGVLNGIESDIASRALKGEDSSAVTGDFHLSMRFARDFLMEPRCETFVVKIIERHAQRLRQHIRRIQNQPSA